MAASSTQCFMPTTPSAFIQAPSASTGGGRPASLPRSTTTLRGADRKPVERLAGTLEWVAALAPHLRALVDTVRGATFRAAADTDTVPTNTESVTDPQRLSPHFQPGRPRWCRSSSFVGQPTPDRHGTDASGLDAFGGHLDGLFWTEQLTPGQQLTPEALARDENGPGLVRARPLRQASRVAGPVRRGDDRRPPPPEQDRAMDNIGPLGKDFSQELTKILLKAARVTA